LTSYKAPDLPDLDNTNHGASIRRGIIAVESLFDVPGLGNLALKAAGRRDFAVLQRIVLLAGCSFIGQTLLARIFSIALDPRLRMGNKATKFELGMQIDQSRMSPL